MKNEHPPSPYENIVKFYSNSVFQTSKTSKNEGRIAKKEVCVNRESNARPIDGNDRGYHYPTDASLVGIETEKIVSYTVPRALPPIRWVATTALYSLHGIYRCVSPSRRLVFSRCRLKDHLINLCIKDSEMCGIRHIIPISLKPKVKQMFRGNETREKIAIIVALYISCPLLSPQDIR